MRLAAREAKPQTTNVWTAKQFRTRHQRISTRVVRKTLLICGRNCGTVKSFKKPDHSLISFL